tara:strand:- start:1315 stop:2346 length:1032 start_codon:yes stop_codon:yes gene_type:complete
MQFDKDYLNKLVTNEQWEEIIFYLEQSDFSNDWHKNIKLINLWKAHTKLNNKEKSILYLKMALDNDPDNATLNRAYGDYYYSEDNYDLAEKYFRRALKNNRRVASFNLRLANTLLRKGAKDKALEYFHLAKKNDLNLDLDSLINEIERQISTNTNEASSNYYDEVYAVSDKYNIHGSESVFTKIWSRVVNLIKEQQSNSILDFGCGPGQFAEYLNTKIPQIQYTGLDFSNEAIQKAKKKNLDNNFFRVSLPCKDYSIYSDYDLIICIEVLEHIENDLEVLESIPSDTPLIITVPNYKSFGHLRIFKSQEEVKFRYESYFDEIKIEPIKISNKNTIWLSYGKKS